MGVLNPLNQQMCNDIDAVLQSCPDITDTIAACERCGMDLTAEKERVQAQKEFATNVKREFNPLAP